jgi:peptide/nickel transport system substrate-binding protein
MNVSKRLTWSLVAGLLALGVPAATAAQEDASGGTLVAAISGEPDQLDPQATTAYFSFQVLENVFDTLVEPDENLQMQPALAEDWTISDDGLTYTFDLREGVTWHDGTPFTASDVVYSFRRIIDVPMANSWRFSNVTDISAPDDQTVVFTVSQPTPNLLSNLGAFKGMAVVQQANVESGDIQTAPIGTGPFKVDEYTSGSSIELARNEDYWGGAPALDGVTFQFIPDPTVALTNLQGGEVHWTDNLPPQQVSGLMDSTEIVVESAPSNDYWYFAANQAREPFSDVRVRQALAYAIDREAITQAATFGNATINQTAIPATSAWYVEYAPYTRDLDMARSLLEEAGVSDLSLDLMVTSQFPETVTAAQVIAANLAEIDVTVEIRTLDFATWLDEQGQGNFDAFFLGWLGNLDPDDFYFAQHRTDGGFNFQGYSNPEVDELLDAGRIETDQDARKALYDDAARMIVDDASYVYLYNPDVIQGWSPDVEGYTVRGDRAIRFRDVTLAQ